MAVVRRERTARSGRKKAYSWQVRWRLAKSLDLTRPWQSMTVDNEADARALDAAILEAGSIFRDTDPEVRTLALIGAQVDLPSDEQAARNAQIAGITVADAVYTWAHRPGLEPGSLRVYANVHKNLNGLGSVRVAVVSEEEVNKWLREKESALSANSLYVSKTALKAALKPYGKEGACTWGRSKSTKHRTEVQPIYLDDAQVDALVAVVAERDGANLARAVRLTARLGTRWGETFGLEKRALVLDTPSEPMLSVFQILANEARLANGYKPKRPKSESSTRLVPMPVWLAEEMALAAEPLGYNDVLFKPANAGFWVYRTFLYRWKTAVLACPEVPDSLRFHDLRHTAAKRMLVNGAPLHFVSRVLGHTTVDITASLYGGFGDASSMGIVRRAME